VKKRYTEGQTIGFLREAAAASMTLPPALKAEGRAVAPALLCRVAWRTTSQLNVPSVW
jgi:hypothetical protein